MTRMAIRKVDEPVEATDSQQMTGQARAGPMAARVRSKGHVQGAVARP